MSRRPQVDAEEDELARFMREAEEDDKTYVPVNDRRKRSSLDNDGGPSLGEREDNSLLKQASEMRSKLLASDENAIKKMKQEYDESMLLKEAERVAAHALQSNEEIATGVRYTDSLPTTWSAPRYMLQASEERHAEVRRRRRILVEGEDCPPPIETFREMKFPSVLLRSLERKGILAPTPIQIQAIPALLSGRDVIGIAFTGSGKTLTFTLPMIMFALEEEVNMPLVAGEGPIGLVLCPSRELARQTYEIVDYLAQALREERYPEIRSTLIVGGEDKRSQIMTAQTRGVHCIVATPGRMNDLLDQGKLQLDICKYLVLDEGDRMLDLGFDEEVHRIINRFKRQRQTVLFSATMPQKFREFARHTLIRPLIVNVGRAGAANLDVVQEVEYVKKEARVVQLLRCLLKTAPAIIFCERKGDVDEIHEYLLLKGVEAVSIHGGKDQEERNEAIRLYKEGRMVSWLVKRSISLCVGKKDVLVATDIAAKGLDFPEIQHVINFDMPSEIESYGN